MECFFCRSANVRRSSFRSYDLPRLLSLKIPIRCRSCYKRFYAKASTAWRLLFR